MRIKKIKVEQRLFYTIFIITSIVVFSAFLGVYNLNMLNKSANLIIKEQQPLLTSMASITNSVLFHSLKVNQFLGTGNKAHLVKLKELENTARINLNNLKAYTHDTEDAKTVLDMEADYRTYLSLSGRLLKSVKGNQRTISQTEGNQVIIAALLENGLLKKASMFYEKKKMEADALIAKNRTRYLFTIHITVAFSLFLIIFSVFHTIFLSNAIVKPITHLVRTAQQVTAGDLTARAQIEADDEIGTLASAFNNMSQQLQKLIESLEKRIYDRTRELSEERNFITTVLDNADVLVVVFLQDGSIIRLNKMCEKITGSADPEMKKGAFWDVFCVQDESVRMKKAISALTNSKNPFSLESHCFSSSHALRLVAWSFSYLHDESEAVTHIIATGIDITEQRKAEQALLQTKNEAEMANKYKSEFLANLSHEIRTPMNGILGITELLLTSSALTKEQREYTEIVHESAESLMIIMNDILDFSKIESGKMEIMISEFDLRATVENVVNLLSAKASEKGLNVDFYIAPELPAAVRGDQIRIQQVFLNLTGNAIKFTEKGGVSIRVVLTQETATHVTALCSVSDTGIGIPNDKLDKLFKSFSQVDGSATRRFSGTGLGLVISKRLTEIMGGDISVISELGKGSTFSFTLKLEKQTEAKKILPFEKEEAAPRSSSVPEIRDKQILLVEDNPVNQKLVKRLLEKFECIVAVATNGREAVVLLEKLHFDLVLMDIQMPEMDGFETTKIIRDPDSSVMDHHIPIIALTAHAMKEDQQRCLSAGMDDYLLKPFKQEELLKAIHRNLRFKGYLSG